MCPGPGVLAKGRPGVMNGRQIGGGQSRPEREVWVSLDQGDQNVSKNSEELVSGFEGKYRIQLVVQQDCPDCGERMKEAEKPEREEAVTVCSRRDVGAVPGGDRGVVLSLPDSVIGVS